MKRHLVAGTPSAPSQAISLPTAFQPAEDATEISSIAHVCRCTEDAIVGAKEQVEFFARQPNRLGKRLRKALQNPSFVEALDRLESSMDLANQAPLRKLVIHYRSVDPLYSSDDVTVHISVHQAIREFLVLCSRQGRIRPEHPDWPLSAAGFTPKVIRNPLQV